MVNTLGIVGIAILVVGLVVGVIGVVMPAKTNIHQEFTLLNTNFAVDPNDYESQNVVLAKGQTITLNVSIDNQTVFDVVVMNQSQYYVYYNCAPLCHQPFLGGTGNYSQQANESVAYFLNVSVSPSHPFVGSFTAPANGTYYIVLDNTVGPNWTSFVQSNATSGGWTMGRIEVTTVKSIPAHTVNWALVVPGAVLLVVGGGLGTAGWPSKPKEKQS